MTIQTVIFDWDGTLAKTLHHWIDSYHQAFARRDLSFSPTVIVAEFFQEHHKVADRHPSLDFPTIVDEARAHVHKAASKVALYAGALETLSDLKTKGIKLSLVSSSPRGVLEIGLRAHDLAGFFTSVIAGDDGFGHKPDPLPFTETLKRLGTIARTTLIIGDSHVDILAGQAAECRTCLFAPPENGLFHDHVKLRSMNADHDIGHLQALLHHV